MNYLKEVLKLRQLNIPKSVRCQDVKMFYYAIKREG